MMRMKYVLSFVTSGKLRAQSLGHGLAHAVVVPLELLATSNSTSIVLA